MCSIMMVRCVRITTDDATKAFNLSHGSPAGAVQAQKTRKFTINAISPRKPPNIYRACH